MKKKMVVLIALLLVLTVVGTAAADWDDIIVLFPSATGEYREVYCVGGGDIIYMPDDAFSGKLYCLDSD